MKTFFLTLMLIFALGQIIFCQSLNASVFAANYLFDSIDLSVSKKNPTFHNLNTTFAPQKLSGGFITLENAMVNKPDFWGTINYGDPLKKNWTGYPINWRNVLTSMHNAGINTIIIKYLAVQQSSNEPAYFYKKDDENYGPVKDILDNAKALNMQVYLGLWDWDKFSAQRISNKILFGPRSTTNLNDPSDALSHTKEVAGDIWNLYKKHPAFAGWYIPLEVWNIDDQSLEGDVPASKLLNSFYSQVSKYCKIEIAKNEKDDSLKVAAKAKKIAISPFFNITDTSMSTKTAEEITPIYVKILTSSGIDLLIPQDSVVINGIDDRSAAYLLSFHNAVDIVNKNKSDRNSPIDFWINIESFDTSANPVVPASIARIKKQFCIARKANPGSYVTFDYYHYMNPDVSDCHFDQATGKQTIVSTNDSICVNRFSDKAIKSNHAARKQLYDDYLKNFANQKFDLSNSDCEILKY